MALAAQVSEEDDLRCALSSTQQFLASFGLVPSRVAVFMGNDEEHTDDQVEKYPTVEMMRQVIRHERRDDNVAVTLFLEFLLDVQAPPMTLTSFMKALFRANIDPDTNCPGVVNEGAWRVHDILTLTCAYMPFQLALVGFLRGQSHVQETTSHSPEQSQSADSHNLESHRHVQNQDEDQSEIEGHCGVDFEGVITQMVGHRLVAPEFIPDVLESLQLGGAEMAAVRTLLSVYATRVDLLLMERRAAGAISMPTEDQATPFWLRCLIQCIEQNGGQGFSHCVPQSVLTCETWAAAYGQMAYGGRSLSHDSDDDVTSEAGESVASDVTLFGDVDDAPMLPAWTNETPEQRERRQQRNNEVLADNLDHISKQKRTRDFVENCDMAIPHVMAIFHHELQLRAIAQDQPEPGVPSETDDSASVVTYVSTSTENNSHVLDVEASHANFWATREQFRNSDEGQINLHRYQDEVLQWAREGKNVAIFLPTGTGKTFVVLKYVQEYLSRPGINRVVFLAPKVKLAEQQFHRFRSFFPKVTYFRCGRSRSSPAPFCELLDSYKVFVMTPQCLVEAVNGKEVAMTDFSMLVLDECHHVGQGKHAYKVLMGLYLKAKYADEQNLKKLPQVIGLTASPGVGQGGSLQSAVLHISELCYMMDVEKICTVQQNKDELQYFVNEPKHEIHTCPRRKRDGFRTIIESIMGQIEDYMVGIADAEIRLSTESRESLKQALKAPSLQRGRPPYNNWVSSLDSKLTVFAQLKDTYTRLFSMAEMLIIYQKCLILNEDCESEYALEFLKEQTKTLEYQVPDSGIRTTERSLLDQLTRHMAELERACNDPEDRNPKLNLLEEILLEIIDKNQAQSSCMVFVRTLELTKAIQRWINGHSQLKFLNPGRMTGSKRAVTDGGMTRLEISDVMEKFNKGEHKVVVCTSAADEGLDFQACNIVVRYDYVTSMISMIQTRGRARQMDSQYCVLGNLRQGNVDKEKENLAAERLMHQAVDKVTTYMENNPNAFVADMAKWQQGERLRQKMEDMRVDEKDRRRNVPNKVYKLLCRKCQCFVCMSSDFRLLEQSNRAVVALDFRGRWKRVERGETHQYKLNVEKVAKVHCSACSYDWGILIRYTPTGKLLPVLKIESFFLEDPTSGEKLIKKLKWSQAPFHVEPIEDEHLM